MLLLTLVVIFVLTLVFSLIKVFSYWTAQNVKQVHPIYLFINICKLLTKKTTFAELVDNIYNEFEGCRYFGIYQTILPSLVIRDPELIKQIAVKDFEYFLDHRPLVPVNADPLWGRNLFSLRGEEWKRMRMTLSPTFTSSKMKMMFNLISECGKQFTDFFTNKNQDIVEVDIKDTFQRFTSDVIASAVFGVECDSLNDRNNEFFLMGMEVADFLRFPRNLLILSYMLFPRLIEAISPGLFSKGLSSFFRNLMKESMDLRKKEGIVRPDMIHLLMEAKSGRLKHDEPSSSTPEAGFASVKEELTGEKDKKPVITLDDITAQGLIFFFAGFDTVAGIMSSMAYELALNPEVQQKLQVEIDAVFEECEGQLKYDGLMKMKYLDMVISETLRKWPGAIAPDRVCVKPYTIQPKLPGEQPVHLKVGDSVWIPIYAIQKDPKYFPEPEKFWPDRFNDENKASINSASFIPFGIGPRNCIGSRFALLETKVVFFHLLSKFEIVTVSSTPLKAKIGLHTLNLSLEDGVVLGFKRRQDSGYLTT